jgi:2-haloacid dehalogenase
VTFDCYGTLVDWNAGMSAALEPLAGPGGRAGPLLAAYHQAELLLEAGPQWLPYRSVLTSGLVMAARRTGLALAGNDCAALVDAWPSLPVFPDTAPALAALAAAGWKLAILTNCDDDLFRPTAAQLPAGFDLVVTAEQVRSYKPGLAHFRQFAARTGATPSSWIHVGCSWVHDVLPAARLGIRSVWVDRDRTGHPAKLAERRITAMRRLPETVADVAAVPAWPAPGA